MEGIFNDEYRFEKERTFSRRPFLRFSAFLLRALSLLASSVSYLARESLDSLADQLGDCLSYYPKSGQLCSARSPRRVITWPAERDNKSEDEGQPQGSFVSGE